MYKVETSGGLIFLCEEESDAINLADNLWQDLGPDIDVVVTLNGEEIYRPDT